VVIRLAMPADAMNVARVHVRAWQHAYRGLMPDAPLDALDPAERAARYTFGTDDPTRPTTLLADDDGAIVGFTTIGPAKTSLDFPGAGEVYALNVDPERWRQGVGRVLLAEACTRLAARGHTLAVLWMLVGNTRASRFYETLGWALDDGRRTETVWGIEAHQMRYHRALG
jgi:GNAT superfamily N-acetyltransferase